MSHRGRYARKKRRHPGMATRVAALIVYVRLGLLAADGPGAVAAARVAHLLGHRDLLGLAGLVRVVRVLVAAVGVPGALVELQAAVVAVAGVRGPVAAGLALRDAIPDTGVADGGLGRGL